MKWLTRLFLLLGVLALTSCFEIPEFKGISNFKLGEFKSNSISFEMDVDVFNPNGFGIRIRRSTFDVYVNDQYIGKGQLEKSFKMKRKRNTTCHVPVTVKLERGILMKAIKWAQSETIELKIDGKIKTFVGGFPKSKKIEQTQIIKPKDLNINFNQLLGL